MGTEVVKVFRGRTPIGAPKSYSNFFSSEEEFHNHALEAAKEYKRMNPEASHVEITYYDDPSSTPLWRRIVHVGENE